MNNQVMKGLAAALCVSLSLSALTGCSGKKEAQTDLTKPAVTLADDSISRAAANFILRYEQAEFENGIGMLYRYYMGDTDLWNQDLTGSGVAYGITFRNEQQDQMRHMLLARAHMGDYGVEITDDDKAAIEAAATAFLADNNEETLEKMSATQESVTEALTLYTILSRVEDGLAGEVDTYVSDEEAAQRTVSYISFTATTEEEEEAVTEAWEEISEAETVEEGSASIEEESDANTGSADVEEDPEEITEAEAETEELDPAQEEARARAKEQAEQFLASAQGVDNGEDFDAMAADAAEGRSNVYSSSFTFGSSSTYPSAPVIAATEGLDDNTLVNQVVQDNDTFYVLFVTDAFDEEATESEKESIVSTRISEHQEEVFETWEGESEFTVDEEYFNTLIFDFTLTEETEEETEELSEAWEEDITETASESAGE
ncbi:MAG: hypothetical protein IJI24_05365 [Lachnospiraceae bacterium]|nr:hypothetical protein [Lachnospiraceae bacterium]